MTNDLEKSPNSFQWRTVAFIVIIVAAVVISVESQTVPIRPNIVLILTDDQGADLVSKMPFLAGKPGGKWVEFTNAFLNTALCCPSRATILSGQYSHHTGVETNLVANGGQNFNESSTLATWLNNAGYRTGLIGKYLNRYPFGRGSYVPPGWDYWAAFGSGSGIDYHNYTIHENGVVTTYGSTEAEYSTDVLKQKALTFINDPSPEPFFLYFAPFAPHAPRTPANRHQNAYSDLVMTKSPNFNEADVTDKPGWIQNLGLLNKREKTVIDTEYRKSAQTLLAVDEAFQAMYQAVEAKGQLGNTVFIFMTDNGYSFGAHRFWDDAAGKKCVYEECIRTPLIVYYPTGTQNTTVTQFMSNVDIAPSIAELAGVSPSHAVDGMSFVPFLNNVLPGTWRDAVLLRWIGGDGGIVPGFWAVRTDSWKYVELNDGAKELYDLVNDPYELMNVADNPSYATIQAELKAKLDNMKL